MTTTTSHDHLTERARLTPERLMARVDRASSLLAERLDDARKDHDLTWRGLLSAQEGVAGAQRAGSTPDIDTFWHVTASPMAQPLVDQAQAAIDESVDLITTGLRRLGPGPAIHADALSEQIVMRWSTVAMDQAPLDELGRRWQRRLRRSAIGATLVRTVSRPMREFGAHLEQTELAMLDDAPWRHGDRLLTAFELAHADVRGALRQGRTDIEAAIAVARCDSVVMSRGSRQQLFGPGGESTR